MASDRKGSPKAKEVAPTASFGERLRRIRKEKGLTLERLADEAGSDKGSLSAYENGKHQPHIETVARLARALGCSTDELIPEPHDPTVAP